MVALSGNQRTITAIQKADALPRNLSSGAMKKKATPANNATSVSRPWAVITEVTNANNYVCSIWTSRGSYVNSDTASETLKQVRVPDIVDAMAIGDGFPVSTSVIDGEDYECIQQMGDV